MARIAGIQLEKDRKGRLTYARFNLKKHPEAIQLLTKIGAIKKEDFEAEWEKAITGDELMNRIKPRIKRLFDK
jgi:hypothetical protein